MTILSAQSIRQLCKSAPAFALVRPFHERTKAHGKTFGLSAAGYDIRIAQTIWIWPFWGRLASSVEHFDMPKDVIAFVHDKSTWARRFVFVQNTVIEPGWHGYLTLELTRFLPWPVRIKAGTPIAQIIFHWLDETTDQPYDGKYQAQGNCPTPAILEPGNAG